MANQVPYYFFPPTWDYPPGGPIKLGNIITSIKRPERPIYTAPSSLSSMDGSEVFTTEKYNVEFSRERVQAGRFSVLTKFLSAVVGLGVDVGVEVDNSIQETYSFSKIATTQFHPNPSYIQSCLASPASSDLLRYLQISRYRKPVYIITGIKSATTTTFPDPNLTSPSLATAQIQQTPTSLSNSSGSSTRTQTLSASVSVELDGTVLSGGVAPVGGGPSVSKFETTKTGMSWTGGSEFVFAFRVRKVWIGKRAGVGVRKEEDYRRGAMLGVDEDGDGDGGGGGGGLGLEFDVRVGEEGEGMDGEIELGDFEREDVVDDGGGELVVCGVPVRDAEEED